jgi:hypothetical protein
MKRLFLLGTLMVMALQYGHAETGSDSVNVTLQNARRTIGYKGALVVDGKTVTLKNKTLTASAGNEIAVLVVNGGKLVLDHCTIQKTGDGIRSGGNGQRGQGRPEMGGQRGQGRPEMNGQGRPEMGGQRGQGRPGRPGGGGGGNADDSFNFYGLNSAVVAVGEGSLIEMKGCTVTTDAEFANAVFSCDNAHVRITDGITIRTTKNSSRGLYATCAGVIEAEGVVDIDTKGAHCAALATDRGGGTVTVGSPNTKHHSRLNTAGSGSPCIYSTGDITAYKASGAALVSQTMVVEGKNTITIEDCSFSGKSPKHGGVMLYQSTSGDAKEGTSVLSMKKCTLRDNSGTAMFLVTNTHSIVNMEDCTFLDPEGKPLSVDYPLVTCRNCNGDGHNWGREGSNGGQVELNLVNQSLTGTLLANETESVITIKTDKGSAKNNLRQANGKGSIYNR